MRETLLHVYSRFNFIIYTFDDNQSDELFNYFLAISAQARRIRFTQNISRDCSRTILLHQRTLGWPRRRRWRDSSSFQAFTRADKFWEVPQFFPVTSGRGLRKRVKIWDRIPYLLQTAVKMEPLPWTLYTQSITGAAFDERLMLPVMAGVLPPFTRRHTLLYRDNTEIVFFLSSSISFSKIDTWFLNHPSFIFSMSKPLWDMALPFTKRFPLFLFFFAWQCELMRSQVDKQGPAVVFARSKSGGVFGGYNPKGW